jgi:catechol 2,3-dioxygenase-like lactoylglutathione lyase family enzyme
MISGSHTIVFSSDPDADRDFFRDVLALPHVDVGEGWLIFGLPPSEVAVHGAEEGNAGSHELYLMTEDVEAFIEAVRARDLEATDVSDQGWGLVTQVTLPGGGKLGVYQARHERPENPGTKPARGSKPRAAKPRAAKKKKATKKKAVKAKPVQLAKKKKAGKKKR